MDEQSSPTEDSCEIEYVCGKPKVDIRVGDEYQVEIPPMMSESERASVHLNPLDSDSSCSFAVGRSIEVMWIGTKRGDGQGLGDDNVDMNESLKSLKTKRNRRGESDGNSGAKQQMNLEAVPGKPSSSWEDLEVDCFVLGLYTFGKNFKQVQKLLESKLTGEILSFYYGKFYKSAKHKIWSNSLKKRSRRCIQGKTIFSGWRLQQLLSRLIPSITNESKKQKLINVSKKFAEGKTSLEEYISAVKELVGLQCLVSAVAIGKDKEDLTVLTTEPAKAKQWFTVSSAIPAGLGPYTSLTVGDIIKNLTGGSRLSKARRDDIFWEAVWPRLLARGWHSEQPKDRGYIKSKDHIVFLIPGVKNFSRKLTKQNHYFECISDILTKVVSEPELLEFETAEIKAPNGIIEENTFDQSNKEKHRYLKSPVSSSTYMKFTVVDTTRLSSGGKLCEFREIRNPNQDSSMERIQMMPLDVLKRAKSSDERKNERRRMMKLVDDPIKFMIVDTSVDHGVHPSGIRRRRYLPSDESHCKIRKSLSREGFVGSSQNQSGTNAGVKCKNPKVTGSGVKDETLENVQQGQSKMIKQRLARKSETNNQRSTSSLPIPKRRRLSTCVRKDIKRSCEASLLNPPPGSVDSTKLKIDFSEETENVEIQERSEMKPNGLSPISERVHEPSSSAQQQEPNGFSSSAQQQEPNGFSSSEEQRALHELNSSEQQDESNRLCKDKKCSFKDLGIAKEQEQPIQPPLKLASDKKTTSSTDHGTTKKSAFLEQKQEEHNQEANTDLLRRQSTRKRPLTTRALEALETGFYTPKSIKTTYKPRKRERSTNVKKAYVTNRTQGESDNGSLVEEATSSKPLDQIEDSDPSFLVNKATIPSKHVDQTEDSKKVTTKFPKLPPIVLKLPFKRG